MNIGYREEEERKDERYSPLTSRKGIIERIDFQSGLADVRIVGGTQAVVKNVQISNLVPESARAGDLCVVDLFDENNVNDCVVAYTYARKTAISSKGSVTISGNSTIAHCLGEVPNFVSVIFGDSPNGDGWYQWQAADDTNIYISMSGSHLIYWYAAVY